MFVGIISENSLYEPTMSGFVKNETFGRLKTLNRQGCLIAVMKCNEIDPEMGRLGEDICKTLDDLGKLHSHTFNIKTNHLVDKYQDFEKINMDIGEQFLTEVLKRTKEILNHITRQNKNMLYEALKVYFKFFAAKKKEGIAEDSDEDNLNNYHLSTLEMTKMLDFLKLPNDVLAPLMSEIKDDLFKSDKDNNKHYNFDQTLDLLEKFEVIQQFELSEYEKESTFNLQFFLRVLHEVNMCDLRMNHKYVDEKSFVSERALEDDENDDNVIDRSVPIEKDPEFWITDVNDMIHPLPDNYKKLF